MMSNVSGDVFAGFGDFMQVIIKAEIAPGKRLVGTNHQRSSAPVLPAARGHPV